MTVLRYELKQHMGFICYPDNDLSWKADKVKYEKKGYKCNLE